MGRLQETFQDLARLKRTALIPYSTAGFPDPAVTPDLLLALAAAGADVIELGVPFSDPLADGVTIQRSSQQALLAGVTPETCFEFVRAARRKGLRQPVVLMGYINPILRRGLDWYVETAAEAGVDGLIVPDLPVEEAAGVRAAGDRTGVDLIGLVAPTSTDDRIRQVAEHSSGFLYCVSLTGVTGARTAVQSGLSAFLDRVRRQTVLPLAVGFGIGTPEQAAEVARWADGVVVGSALIDRIERAGAAGATAAAGEFLAGFRQAIDAAGEAVRVP